MANMKSANLARKYRGDDVKPGKVKVYTKAEVKAFNKARAAEAAAKAAK